MRSIRNTLIGIGSSAIWPVSEPARNHREALTPGPRPGQTVCLPT